jgi:hypothetical protein
MEIYEDCKKTYSADERYSLRELKTYYARAAKKNTRRTDINDRSKFELIVWIDEKNAIHFRPLLDDEWIAVNRLRTLEQKIEEHSAFVRGRKLRVVMVIDPKSTPEAAGDVVESLLNKAYVELTLMFGRRVGAQGETKKVNPMDIYPDSTKTYCANEVYSLRELKSLYTRVAKKTPQRKDLSDRNKADVLVSLDAENHIHFRPVLPDEWIRLDDVRTVATKLDENTWVIYGRKLAVFLVLDPKSDPEAAGKIVQLVLEEKKYVELTLMLGRRVVAEPKKSKK